MEGEPGVKKRERGGTNEERKKRAFFAFFLCSFVPLSLYYKLIQPFGHRGKTLVHHSLPPFSLLILHSILSFTSLSSFITVRMGRGIGGMMNEPQRILVCVNEVREF